VELVDYNRSEFGRLLCPLMEEMLHSLPEEKSREIEPAMRSGRFSFFDPPIV
jgi:hypothetical protein